MGIQGINRIVIAVKDLEAAKNRYTQLLGAEFHDAHWTGEPFGILVSIAWNAGIELCAPAPGRESDSAVSAFLNTKGEGIMSVYFNVPDAEKAMDQASQAGFSCLHALDYTQEEIDQHLQGFFKRYQEMVLNSANLCGFSVSLARIEKK